MIKLDLLGQALLETNNLIPIKIIRDGEKLTVYITKATIEGKIWARHFNESQDTLIYPTKRVTIVKVGSKMVQTEDDYNRDKEDYFAYQREKEAKKIKANYASAKHHAKRLGGD